MWRLGFFFHEMAFGLLSVFIPLYVVSQAIGGSLVDLGIMTSVALFLAIPASFFWGYICDKTRRFKLYILLSFISAAVLLYLFTFATNVITFIVLYVVMSMLHVAHEAPKNVLVAEHYSRDGWGKAYALYEGFTEIGWLIGLLLGFFASATALSANHILLLCSGLNLVAFVLSIFLVADPVLIFERRLVSIEKKIDYAYRGAGTFSKLMDGVRLREKLKTESFAAFGTALVLFSLASSLFFTPLPIFFAKELVFPTSMVFMVYMLSSGGAVVGYFLAGRSASSPGAKAYMQRIVLLRSALIFSLAVFVNFVVSTTILASVILVLLGFAYAFYYILTLSLSMELIPPGRSGLFDGLVGLGAASGSFLGPFLAETLGFLPQFLIAGSVFFLAFLVLKIFT
ncbi:MAG: MFS transporter [Candidatus Bathyarchaeota archaeon]|nr:MFS transporter [Candidatus Bathyarchaeota archaeon]